MTVAIAAIHVLMCVLLILIVLLQTGKGADIGAAFGGGSSQTIFGSAGPGGFLTKITTVVAVIFMATSISLAYYSSHRGGTMMKETRPARTAPVAPAPKPQPPTPVEKGTPIAPPAEPAPATK